MAGAGLSGANRAFVAQLNRALPGPFTPTDAAKVAGVDHARAARLLRHLAGDFLTGLNEVARKLAVHPKALILAIEKVAEAIDEAEPSSTEATP